jgi:hypothetical protein
VSTTLSNNKEKHHMAAKKKARKGKRKATPAQLAALKKAHAARRANLKAGKPRKKGKALHLKRGPKSKKRLYSATPRFMKEGEFRNMSGNIVQVDGAAMGRALMAAMNAGKKSAIVKRRKSGGKRRKGINPYTGRQRSSAMTVTAPRARKGAKRGGNVVTAATILKGARAGAMKLYLCGGKKRTGCGGGSKVVGILR